MTENTPPKVVKPEFTSSSTPSDAQDIEALWLDTALGDGLTDTSWHTIPVDKPKDFFRVHPDRDYRRRTEVWVRTRQKQSPLPPQRGWVTTHKKAQQNQR